MRLRIALLFALCPLTAAAQIYRWTDANGEVHFSQVPPEQGPYKRMKIYETQGVTPGAGKGASDYLKHAAKSSELDQQAHQAVVQAKAERAERCAKARERISFLEQQTAHRLFKKGADGQPARMTEDQFDQELSQARQLANNSCS